MSLRDYQLSGIGQIKAEFQRGKKRVLLVMPTGSGKTVLFCKMVKDAVLRGKRAIIVVRGRKLVDQASQRLFREQVPHGVLMAGHWNFRPHHAVQVCSIDTLLSRGLKPEADLIIIDEAHMAGSGGYKEFLDLYDTFLVSVTATPYVPGGLRHLADSMVRPIRMQDLIDQGHLVPFRYFAPTEPNLEGVKVSSSTKDYVVEQLEERMVEGQLTGQIVEHWRNIAQDRRTLCFAVNVHHSKILVEKFLAAGVSAEHVDAGCSDTKRNDVIRRLELGKTKVVSNVGIFCTGVDIPSVDCIVGARPTKSYNLFIQQAGRGTRTAKGKLDCILLDHAGNIKRHGFPTLEPEVDLDGKGKEESADLETKLCKTCFAMYRGKLCPECGTPPPTPPKKEILETDEELQEIKITAKDPVGQWLEYLEKQRGQRKWGWQFHKLVDKFGWEKSLPYLPANFVKLHENKYNFMGTTPFDGAPFDGFGGEK